MLARSLLLLVLVLASLQFSAVAQSKISPLFYKQLYSQNDVSSLFYYKVE